MKNYNFIRYYIINVFSLIKRFFLDPLLYNAIKFIPLLFIPGRYIDKRSVSISFILIVILGLSGNIRLVPYLVPFFLLIVFQPSFRKINFGKFVSKTRWFLLVVVLYSVAQLVVGFFPFEISWINSSLSVINSDNIFITNRNIKPFSTFAGNPEYSFFCVIYLYYYIKKREKFWSLVSLVGLILSGTRGIMIAAFLAFIFTSLFKINSKYKAYIYSMSVSLSLFFMAVRNFDYLNQISQLFATSRLLLFGTFYGRFINQQEKLDNTSLLDFVIPSKINFDGASSLTLDNLHLTLLFNFGLIGYVIFWNIFKIRGNHKKSMFFFIVIIIYGLLADIIYSFYLMFLIILVINSKE